MDRQEKHLSMLPFRLQQEPPSFDDNVRQKGLSWIRNTPDASQRKRPQNYWRHCLTDLRHAFQNICPYAAMRIDAKGTVDHFESWARTKATNPGLAYEWSNYRFCSSAMNSLKNKFDEDVLDPFEVQNGWFRVTLPDMQLILTDQVPPAQRALAERTIERLQLRDGEDLIEFRLEWYNQYKAGGEPILEMMESWAPLVATAIREKLEVGEPLP